MMVHHFYIFFMVYLNGMEYSIARPTTTVMQGKLSGSWMRTRGGRRIAAFRGVPYAVAPVGELRFESPKPLSPWGGTRLAREDGSKCVQYNPLLGIYGEEDCLYLNIFTPNITRSPKLPVLFFIHGGAFKTGSGGSFLYGPKYLLDEDIVLVTVNYRLGIFGFLSLEDTVLPGNLGLKDQRAALRWVRDNIAQFGGDPTAVTLFGESAGAASVHYHMLYNFKEGLFRAGICHSGSALTGGKFQRPGDQKLLIDHILNETSCPSENSSAIVDCLRKIRPYKLIRIMQSLSPPPESLMKKVELSPVIEPDCVDDAFITGYPWNSTSSLPMIIGTNKYEALFTIADMLKDETDELFEMFNKNYEMILPYNLMIETSAKDPSSVIKSLHSFYFKNVSINRENVLQLVDLLSDGLFNYGTTVAIKNNLNKSFLYSFNYHGSKSLLNLLGYDNEYGPTHVDDLFFFFPFSLRQAERDSNSNSENDKALSKQLIKIWTDFATYLDPSPGGSSVQWKPVSSPDLHYLSINGPDNFSMEADFYKERMVYWDNLPFRNQPLLGQCCSC